jgi:hypothetical protein
MSIQASQIIQAVVDSNTEDGAFHEQWIHLGSGKRVNFRSHTHPMTMSLSHAALAASINCMTVRVVETKKRK